MKFTAKEVIRGISNESYNIDGQTINVQVAHMDTALREDVGGKGFRTHPIKFASDEVVQSIKHNPFPMLAEVEMEQRATKGKAELFLLSVKPIKAVGTPGDSQVAPAQKVG